MDDTSAHHPDPSPVDADAGAGAGAGHGDDVLYLFSEKTTTDKMLCAWRGNLAHATVRDLHVWIINIENIASFVVAYKRARDQPPHGTVMVPVYDGSWAATLASTGFRSGDVVVLGKPISLPCTAYRLPTLRAPFTQFDLGENHRLQATLLDDAMFVWAPATWKRAAEAIKSLDGAMAWRAAVMRILAHHVTTIPGPEDPEAEAVNGGYANMKAVKSLMHIWTVLGPPSSPSSSSSPPPGLLVEAIHALTVLLSKPHNCSFRRPPMTAFCVGDALAPLCALVSQSVPGGAYPSEDAVAFVKEPAAERDEDPAVSGSSLQRAALEQLAGVVKRATNGGRKFAAFFAVPSSAFRELLALFRRPFFAARGIQWEIAEPPSASSAFASSPMTSSSMNAMLMNAMLRAASATPSRGSGEIMSNEDAMRLLHALGRRT